MRRFESRVERMIREATECGEFDNLPGAGKPLDLTDSDDLDWWVKRKIRDENLDSSALRREAQDFLESLRDIADEDAVRDILVDFNRRVREAHWRRVRWRCRTVSSRTPSTSTT